MGNANNIKIEQPAETQPNESKPNDKAKAPEGKKYRKLGVTFCALAIALMVTSLIGLWLFCMSDLDLIPALCTFIIAYGAAWILLLIAKVKSEIKMSKIVLVVFIVIAAVIGVYFIPYMIWSLDLYYMF